MLFQGWIIGLFEILGYLTITTKLRHVFPQLDTMGVFPVYWFCMTILTMIWECCYIFNYDYIVDTSDKFIKDKKHAWTNKYSLSYVMPHKVANIFYAEYGAWADRMYMFRYNDWSRTVEGSHALMCGLFALITIIAKIQGNDTLALSSYSISMASQLMNSWLYMINYFNECGEKDSSNFDSPDWPAGVALTKRPFMYVNVCWFLFPAYCLLRALL